MNGFIYENKSVAFHSLSSGMDPSVLYAVVRYLFCFCMRFDPSCCFGVLTSSLC